MFVRVQTIAFKGGSEDLYDDYIVNNTALCA